MKITVFTKPECVQCEYTKKQMDKLGIAYEAIDVTEDESARDRLKATGRTAMPVVVVKRDGQPPDVWEGFRLSKIRGLIQEDHS